MASLTVIAVNQTGSPLSLTRLSCPDQEIPGSGQVTLTDFNTIEEIKNDSQLLVHIQAGDCLINDGTRTLNQAESERFLSSVAFGLGSTTAGVILVYDQVTNTLTGSTVRIAANGDLILGAQGKLSGSLSSSHGFADVTNHSASTLAEVNTLISDATLYEWENDLGGTQVHANNVPDGADATAIHDNVSGEINAITQKTAPVGGDWLLIEDSAASNAKKRVAWGDITGSGGGLSPHGFADAQYHTAATLAEVNTKISDATLIDTGDSRLSDDRDPNLHGLGNAARHSASSLAELNILISDATLDTNTAERPAAAHGFADVVRHTASTLAEVNSLISDATLYEWENDLGGTQVNANNIPDGADATAIHDNVNGEINAITQKTSPVGGDWLLIEDSAASNAKKRVAWGDITGSGGGLSPHGFADAQYHTAATLAEVNTKISDATLIDTGDSRLSDDRDPNLHGLGNAARHSASSLAELNALVSDATLDTNTAERPAASHGFADVVRHTASTLAEVNSLISDATLYEWENDLGGTQVNANNVPDGADATAIHDNVNGEINAITQKTSPVGGDWLLIEDSAASNAKKRVAWGDITGSGGGLSPHGFADAQYHTAATLAEVNTKISDATLDTNTAERPAAAHGFADVVRHTASTLAEVNTLVSDATLDTNTAERPAASHGFADVVRHTASTLAEVNSLISDATLYEWENDQGGTQVNANNVPDGADATAIHDNVNGEISAITQKTAPVGGDWLLIEDSAASNAKKKVAWGDITGSGGGLVAHGFADVVYHTAALLSEVNSLISDATLDTNTAERPAAAHGFADVVRHTSSLLSEVNSLISDATLDTNTAARPAASHGFADETRHSASTIAQVNALVSDGNLVAELQKAVTITDPASSETFTLWRTNVAITITELNAVVSGASTPSVNWQIRHASDRTNAGNAVMSASVTTTSTTTGDRVNTFTSGDPTIPAQSWVWLELGTVSGTPDHVNVTLDYTVD